MLSANKKLTNQVIKSLFYMTSRYSWWEIRTCYYKSFLTLVILIVLTTHLFRKSWLNNSRHMKNTYALIASDWSWCVAQAAQHTIWGVSVWYNKTLNLYVYIYKMYAARRIILLFRIDHFTHAQIQFRLNGFGDPPLPPYNDTYNKRPILY